MTKNKIPIAANPSKKFFLEMLTRDITLTNCILDLIDNSVDSVMRRTKFDPMESFFTKGNKLQNYKISIHFSEKEFVIEDNSGGISEDKIKDQVFRFGSNTDRDKGIGLSVYGIGMKRAFLKMGKSILFESVSPNDTTRVSINVDSWMQNDKWDLEGESEKKVSAKTGTKITIKDLNDQIAFNFKSIPFEAKLLEKVNDVYGIFLANKLTIEVNGKKAVCSMPKMAQSDDLKPSIETFEKYGAKVKIYAGLSSGGANGWYIFCNGRLILSGDKTELTGWGNGLRKFHASTNRFVGFVYFESEDVSILPWMTTKDGVNYDSALYQYTLKEMVKMADPVIKFLTSQYKEKDNEELRKLVKDAKEVSVETLKIQNQKFSESISMSKKVVKNETISYSVPIRDMEKIKKIIGNGSMSNAEIGEKTFYYFIDHEE